jgi:hypothetical protein
MSSFGGFGQAPVAAAAVTIEKSTPWMAASDGNLELVQTALASLNLSPSATDEVGYTLLHAAAAYNQRNVLEWIMAQQGVNVNAQDNDGDTPLHHVEHVEAAKFLVGTMQANPTITNSEQKTAWQARHEELQEQMDDEDEDEDEVLKALVEYLKSVTSQC